MINENQKMNKFKHGDVVMVRDHDDQQWLIALYLGYDDTLGKHCVIFSPNQLNFYTDLGYKYNQCKFYIQGGLYL